MIQTPTHSDGVRFKVIIPSSIEGHGTTLLDTREELMTWADHVDFGAGLVVGVEDEIVHNKAEFAAAVDAATGIIEKSRADALAAGAPVSGIGLRESVEVRMMPAMAGGAC